MSRAPVRPRRSVVARAALVALCVLAAWPAAARASSPAAPRWPDEVLKRAARLPLQQGGRIMPLDTWADVVVLQLSHRKRAEDAAGRSLTPLEALLDILLRPEVAQTHPLFTVEDAEVLDAIGLSVPGKKKRDRYALADFVPAQAGLFERADAFERISREKRNHVEDGVVELRRNVQTYLGLRWLLEFARASVPREKLEGLDGVFDGAGPVPFTALLTRRPVLEARARDDGPGAAASRALLAGIEGYGQLGSALALVPPAAPADRAPTWRSPSDLVRAVVRGEEPEAEALAVLRGWERVAAAVDDPRALGVAFHDLGDLVEGLAARRGEGGKIGLEVFLNDLDPFGRALWGFLVAFLVLALSWGFPRRFLVRTGAALTGASLLLLVTGIVLRCVLRERPPMSTLYDTTLFIPAFAVAVLLWVERVSGRGLALALAPALGALGLFVSNRYEELHASDTMPQLIAVLDTNFWLWTHVTCIGIGYSASFVASAFAHLHVGWRALAPARLTRDTETALARLVYGTLCFALVFSVVGTILGGIWANESWGRFWGWDPKENGALLICLVQLAALHARLGGMIGPLGFSLAAVFCGMVVAFSWWGVNLLGIGLHAYGFTRGLWTALIVFWAIEAVVLGAGWLTTLRGPVPAPLAGRPPPPPPSR